MLEISPGLIGIHFELRIFGPRPFSGDQALFNVQKEEILENSQHFIEKVLHFQYVHSHSFYDG